ncbi:MAG TPA: hypothetical protein PLJ21_12920 [Pseudobdellovibrionaceae bacterium]|nr:hypothetical protein [Pseudobdellovibrionaceae bacterium]
MWHFKVFLLISVCIFLNSPELQAKKNKAKRIPDQEKVVTTASDKTTETNPDKVTEKSSEKNIQKIRKEKSKERTYNTYNLSFFSWSEKLNLTQQTINETALAAFNGLSLGLETEMFESNKGTRMMGSFLFGQASAGNNLTQLKYVASYQSFFGVSFLYHWAFRNSDRSLVSLGPIALYRNISWPQSTIVAKSGQDFNLGYTLDMKLRLFKHLELITSLGSLILDASTFWSVGFGYKL